MRSAGDRMLGNEVIERCAPEDVAQHLLVAAARQEDHRGSVRAETRHRRVDGVAGLELDDEHAGSPLDGPSVELAERSDELDREAARLERTRDLTPGRPILDECLNAVVPHACPR